MAYDYSALGLKNWGWGFPAASMQAKPATSAAPKGPNNYFGLPASEFAALQDSEVRRVQGEYDPLRQALQLDLHGRGISRSGFALDEMMGLDAREAGAIGQVAAGNTDRLLQYKQQQEYIRLMKAQQKAQQGGGGNKWLGAALGIGGLVAAPFTGGATLPLAATGATMYLASA